MNQIIISIAIIAVLVFIFYRRAKSHDKQRPIYWDPQAARSGQAGTAQIQTDEKETAPAAPCDLDFSEINRTFRIGDMHFTRGNFAEAEKWFIKVLALNEKHTEAMNLLGVIYIQQGNSRRAEILYRKIFGVTQKEPTYYCNYGRCLYNQGRYHDAIEAYENAIKLDAAKPSRFISIGQIYYELKDYVQALSYFLKALKIDPRNIEYLMIAEELAGMTGDSERQHKCLKKILAINPYNEEAKNKLSKLAIKEPHLSSSE